MDYEELTDIRFVELDWERHVVSANNPDDDTFGMSLQELLDRMFWAADASFEDNKWTHVPKYHYDPPAIFAGDMDVKFSDGKHEYNMRLVRADNDTVKVGETVWWETPEWHNGIIQPRRLMNWKHATKVEVTRKGDNDILEIWQVYGEPHGAWEWHIRKLSNPMAINQLRFK